MFTDRLLKMKCTLSCNSSGGLFRSASWSAATSSVLILAVLIDGGWKNTGHLSDILPDLSNANTLLLLSWSQDWRVNPGELLALHLCLVLHTQMHETDTRFQWGTWHRNNKLTAKTLQSQRLRRRQIAPTSYWGWQRAIATYAPRWWEARSTGVDSRQGGQCGLSRQRTEESTGWAGKIL